jgi:hypothetical protein
MNCWRTLNSIFPTLCRRVFQTINSVTDFGNVCNSPATGVPAKKSGVPAKKRVLRNLTIAALLFRTSADAKIVLTLVVESADASWHPACYPVRWKLNFGDWSLHGLVYKPPGKCFAVDKMALALCHPLNYKQTLSSDGFRCIVKS